MLTTRNAAPSLMIRKQTTGPECDPNRLTRTKLDLYGVPIWIPDVKEDEIIRYMVSQGFSVGRAYASAGLSDLLPPPIMRSCVRQVYASGTTPGGHTCAGILRCLETYLLDIERLTIPWADLPEEAARITEGVPPMPRIPGAWLEWIETVARLLPDMPPPETDMIREGITGPPPEWMAWIRKAAGMLPEIPTPEPLPPEPGRELPRAKEEATLITHEAEPVWMVEHEIVSGPPRLGTLAIIAAVGLLLLSGAD